MNDEDDLLDSAAKIFRGRVSSGSRFQALAESTRAPTGAGTPPGLIEEGEIELPATLRLSRSVESTASRVGDMPPQPPTLRGRIGAVLVQAVRRGLFWYTSQIRTFQGMVAEAAREQATAIRKVETRQQRQELSIGAVRDRLGVLERERAQTVEHLQSIEDRLEAWRKDFEASVHECRKEFAENARHAGTALDLKLGGIERTVEQAVADLRRGVEAEGREVRRQIQQERTRLAQQEFRLNLLLREARKRSPEEVPGDAAQKIADEIQRHEALFVDHAAAFRGERAEIKSRLTVYTPYVQQAFTVTEGAGALDLGCGRGEWLELLRDLHVPASGIDWNHQLVEACRERGLEATQGQIPRCLTAIPDESLSIVTAFHVLEHIPFADLLDVIDHAVRILKPGGIAIFETPNPKNSFVSSNNFYLDPTHRHPIPSEFLAFVVEARGLCDTKVIPLSPYPDDFRLPASECPAVQFINEHFYGPQDYGIVAFKAS